jgi:HSP20 family protein
MSGSQSGAMIEQIVERNRTMLMRFDPFRENDPLSQWFGRQQSGESRQFPMPMDGYREGDQFVVNFDLPGVNPDSIDLTVEKNVLTVRAERTWQPQDGSEVVVSERPQGTFTRQLFLGDGLDTAQITATYRDGVLTLAIPVAEQAKPRKVAISHGNGGATITANTSEKAASEKAASSA